MRVRVSRERKKRRRMKGHSRERNIEIRPAERRTEGRVCVVSSACLFSSSLQRDSTHHSGLQSASSSFSTSSTSYLTGMVFITPVVPKRSPRNKSQLIPSALLPSSLLSLCFFLRALTSAVHKHVQSLSSSLHIRLLDLEDILLRRNTSLQDLDRSGVGDGGKVRFDESFGFEQRVESSSSDEDFGPVGDD